MSEQDQLEQGLAALQAGDKATAQSLLREVVKANPRIVEAWLGLAQTTDDPARQRACYENVLKINPDHAEARAALAELNAASPPDDAASLRSSAPANARGAGIGFAPPQNIPGAPARYTLDDLQATVKGLLASLQATAGRGGRADALPATWWNVVVLVAVMGAATGLIAVLVNLIATRGFGGYSPLALITLTLLMPLRMAAGVAGGALVSRWFLQWRSKAADASLLEHTTAIVRPWFAGSAAILVLMLVGALASGSISTLEVWLLYFSLYTSGISSLLLILSLIVAIGVLYLIDLGWAKLYPESKRTDRLIAAVITLLMITMAA